MTGDVLAGTDRHAPNHAEEREVEPCDTASTDALVNRSGSASPG